MGAASAVSSGAIDRRVDPVAMTMLIVPSLVATPAIVAGAFVAGASGDSAAAAWLVVSIGLLFTVAGSAWAARRSEGPLVVVCGVLCVVGVAFATASVAVFDPVHAAWLAAAVTIPSALMLAGVIVQRTSLFVLGLIAVNLVWAADLALLALDGLRALIVGS